MPFLLLICLALLLVAGLLARPWWVRRRRARIRRQPFPAAWRRILQSHVPYVARMPADLQLQLKQHIQVFLAEKPFLGCRGLMVTEAIRVTVAAQACLLLLNQPDSYFPDLRQILVYPGPFVVDRVHANPAGLLETRRQVLAGESWSQGQVILSWDDVSANAADPDAGRNVVIHEFAHQLDQQTGLANGAPQLHSIGAYAPWSHVFSAEFARLQQQVSQGENTLLDDYGATDPAEFFAVASEAFFMMPVRIAQDHPAMFEQLKGLYCVDPLSW